MFSFIAIKYFYEGEQHSAVISTLASRPNCDEFESPVRKIIDVAELIDSSALLRVSVDSAKKLNSLSNWLVANHTFKKVMNKAQDQPCALAVFEIEAVGRPDGGHLEDHRRRSRENGRHVKRRLKVVGDGGDVIGVDLDLDLFILFFLELGLLHLLRVQGVLALTLSKNLLKQGLPGVWTTEPVKGLEDDAGFRDRLMNGKVRFGQVWPAHLARLSQGVQAGKFHGGLPGGLGLGRGRGCCGLLSSGLSEPKRKISYVGRTSFLANLSQPALL